MLDPQPVLREDRRGGDLDARRELVLVGNEDLEAVRAHCGGALVDEQALVRREERTGEVDLQGADRTRVPHTGPGRGPILDELQRRRTESNLGDQRYLT